MTYAFGIFWVFFGLSVLFWIVAALFGIISRKFIYSGEGDSSPRLIFQITSKHAPQIVDRGIESIRTACTETGYTNFDIWIVTPNPFPELKDKTARRIIVPESFQTIGKFKARSMEFAKRLRAEEGYDGWVYFIDEENWITAQTVKAITNFAAHRKTRLASGPLLFKNGGSYLGWLGDSVRNSEGRISCLHHSIGYWPVHGDNMLLEFGLEKEIGWEFPQLTEDVQFTGYALDKGYRTGWHGGELLSISPSSIADFIIQRRRWFRGILQCIFSQGIGTRYKLTQAYIFITGLMATFALLVIAADMVFNISPFAREWYFSIPVVTLFAFIYFTGCRSNLKDKIIAGLLCCFFSLLEGIAAWDSIFRPPKRFDIIKKR